MTRKVLFLFAALLMANIGIAQDKAAVKVEITPEEFLENIKILASDNLKGRGNGSEGMDQAARIIMEGYQAAGLKPLGGSYYQEFELQTGNDFGNKNLGLLKLKDLELTLNLGKEFMPVSYGGKEIKDLPLVFAGYGIHAPEKKYDDYAHLDVKDKVVLVLDLEPQRDDRNSIFDGTADTQYAQLLNKVLTARSKGAAGIILVTGPLNLKEEEKLPEPGPGYAVQKIGIPGIRVTFATVKPLLEKAGLDLLAIQQGIDKDLKPASKALDLKVSLELDISPRMKKVKNVVGLLEGSDPALKNEYVVIGAHYDHLGMGYVSSMTPDKAGQIHNGADDNASGTSGLIEIAEKLSLGKAQLKRSVIFVAFAGEELGLLGSNYFVDKPPVKKESMVAMVNMDMVGRVRENHLTIGGIGTAKSLKTIMEKLVKESSLDVTLQDTGFASSDNASFTAAKIPAVFFFSGTHGQYHTPDDDWQLINAEKGAEVLNLASATLVELANLDKKPEFTESAAGEVRSGRMGGNRPWFGSTPDFGYKGEGYRFMAVAAESPAGKAGLQAKDILVEFGGKKIGNIYDYTSALGAYQPGDTVEVKVLREGKELVAKVVLTRRK